MINTKTPPDILFGFSNDLLSFPAPELKDNCNKLMRVFRYIENRLKNKSNYGNRQKKYEKLKQEFLILYEQAKKKEDDSTETKTKGQEPFYFITMPYKGDQDLFFGLKCDSYQIF